MSDQAVPVAYQSLSTTVTPTDAGLPRFTFLSIDRERSNNTDAQLEELQHLETWIFHPIEVTHDEISNLVLRLTGGEERTQTATTLFRDFGTSLYDNVEFPTRNSPIRGQTLSGLVSGGGVLAAMEVFHSGVTLGDAILGLVITAGGIVLLGVSTSVMRALSDGLEDKIRSIFGDAKERQVALERDSRSGTSRAKARPGDAVFKDAWMLAENALTRAAVKRGLMPQNQRAGELGIVRVARMLELPLDDFNFIDQLRHVNNDLVDGKSTLKVTEAR